MAKKETGTSKIDLKDLTSDQIKKILRGKDNADLIIGRDEIAKYCKLNKIETGIPTLDFMWSGGITEGRWTTLAGNPSACKSTTTLQILPSLQAHTIAKNEDKYVFYSDAEGSFDFEYAAAHGVNLDRLIVCREKVLEKMFEKAAELIHQGLIGAMVIDSLDGLVPKKSDDNSYGNTMGALSGAISAHLPNLFNATLANNVTTICIRQARVKFNPVPGPEVITFSGGKAYRHFQDSVFIMKRLSNKNLTYTPIQVKAEKTRSSRMGLSFHMPLGDLGIDKVRDLVSLACAHNIIESGGAGWMTYDGVKLQGQEKFVDRIKSDPDMFKSLKEKVYSDIIRVDKLLCQLDSGGDEIITDFNDDEE